MTNPAPAFPTAATPFSAFMLVTGAPEWRALSALQRRCCAHQQLLAVLSGLHGQVSARYLDGVLNSARVTEMWIWSAVDAQAYGRALQGLRASAFWNRCFRIVEVLAGVDETYAREYYRMILPTWIDSGFLGAGSAAITQNVA